MEENKCVKIFIKGIVQGVGFRPFIYRIAIKNNIKGFVINTSEGVEIEAQGHYKDIQNFINDIKKEKPPISIINSIKIHDIDIKNYNDFKILKSETKNSKDTIIPPDLSICEDCINELINPDDRRYKYPFINCTNCGPRFSIIFDIPYDRPLTVMNKFKMCEKCEKEYNNPLDRRFHAQPNACPVCGPSLSLYDKNKKEIKSNDIIKDIIKFIKQGKIIGLKGLGGFHLVVDALNEKAVNELRIRKKRKSKPFAVMSLNIEDIKKYACIKNNNIHNFLTSFQKPIVLLEKKYPYLLAYSVAPNNNYIGVMLPYTPLHYLILYEGNFIALVMTSGNISEEPIIKDNEEAFEKLSEVVDYFVIHNRDIYQKIDDSVVKFIDKKPIFIRRARGYVPNPIILEKYYPPILAVGGELKNTVCFIKENKAYLSQHIGDLKNIDSFEFFENTINHFKKILGIEPEIIGYDLHPNYLSTQYVISNNKDKRLIGIQHHYAHIVSCMIDNNIYEDNVIGIAFDGTGYGTDKKIWGGEILLVNLKEYKRIAHFKYIPLPGGDNAIYNPWKIGISYLYQIYKDNIFELNLPIINQINKKEINIILEILGKNINCPLTSSCGRLFDAISSILGIRYSIDYEAQASIELEMLGELYNRNKNDNLIDEEILNNNIILKESLSMNNFPILIDILQIIKVIVEKYHEIFKKKNINEKEKLSLLSYFFHCNLAYNIALICNKIEEIKNIKKVVLSGGVFQNRLFTEKMLFYLKEMGFIPYIHNKVPPNDGGLSLGQAIISGENNL